MAPHARPSALLPSILVSLLALSPSTAAGAEVPFEGGYPVTTAKRIFALKDVRQGLKGVGYTVLTGAEVEPFGVEVLGVFEGMLGPGQDVIVARLSGPKIEHTGVISGMSGSPVFIGDRLLGAVSYRFGSFPKDPIAGITPIQSMLDVYSSDVGPPAAASAAPLSLAALATHRRTPRQPAPVPAIRFRGGPDDARPIATPIVLGGFTPAIAAHLIERFETAGMVAVAGGGGGKVAGRSPRAGGTLAANALDEAGTVKAAPIAPGGPIAALLMRGDMEIAGTGTVTLVEDGKILAFGHPFFGYGHVTFPMATSAIIHTLASQSGSYKQSQVAREVGAIVHDRLTAIAGDFTTVAPMVPARIRVEQLGARGGAPVTTMNVEIIDDDVWLPLLLDAAISNALSARLGVEVGGTMNVTARIAVRARVLEIRDVFTAFAPMKVGGLVAGDIAAVVQLLARNSIERAAFTRIDVTVEQQPEVELAWLDRISPARDLVRPGEMLRVIASLRPYRGEPVTVPIVVPIPEDAKPGDLELVVGGAIDLDHRDAEVYGERIPSDLDDLLGLLAERRYGRGLYARTYPKAPGLRAGAEILSSLPPSARLALAGRGSLLTKTIEQAFGPAAEVKYPRVVVGVQSITLRVTR